MCTVRPVSSIRPVSLTHAAAQALESGRLDGLFSRLVSTAVSGIAARGLVRPASVPESVGLVCVGGATLGGSGKTRVAIEAARQLSLLGASVALVGHAYRVAPRSSRVVCPTDALEEVGDEALVCARALEGSGVPVVIGPTRQAAIDLAVGLAPAPTFLVLDGPIAIRGRSGPTSLSLLAVDANRPWGSGRLPPAGDLRAPRELLLARADRVVPVEATPTRVRWTSGEVSSVGSLRGRSVGLFTAIARPDRLVRALAGLGVRPHEIVSVPDHGPASLGRDALGRASVDVWLATEKCALHLAKESLGVPVGMLESDLRLPEDVLDALAALSLRQAEHEDRAPRRLLRAPGALTPSTLQP
jgi:tetraacyldisaccharide 4'-kinase